MAALFVKSNLFNPYSEQKLINLNTSFLKIIGSTLEEVKGKHIWEISPEEKSEQINFERETIKNSSEPVVTENWLYSKNGEKHFIRWRKTALKDTNGSITHIIATGIDITDRLEAEKRIKNLNNELRKHASELEIINSELESFSYSVSHDLKAPLNIIGGYSQLIIDDYHTQLNPEILTFLSAIKSNTKKMNVLINDLLTLSRISRTDITIEKIDLSAMISSYLNELQELEPDRKAVFDVQKDIVVYADRRLLHLAIENILTNSWKYCSKRAQTEIQFGSFIKDNRVIYFIKDNGVGFDMKYASKIFEPFQRLQADREFKGTGVGLATVLRVFRRHDGQIWAEAEAGKGATFFFTLGVTGY